MSNLSIASVPLAGVLLVFGCHAQPAGGRPEFEVASIKPAADPRQPGTGQHRFGPQIVGARADYFYMTLRQLIAEAYQVRPTLIEGPDWLTVDRFDVLTKMPPGSRKDDAPAMLRSLLADRFKVVLHRESRDQAVSALVVGPGGPKLKESSAAEEETRNQQSGKADVSVSATMGSVTTRATLDAANSSIRFEAKKARMADLANFLQRFGVGNDRPVVDMTGLKGEYDIVLDVPVAAFSREAGAPGASGEGRPADDAADPASGRVLRSLKDLGLELKKTKAPIEYLVVDRAERKPSEN